jgi:hypothetical protein
LDEKSLNKIADFITKYAPQYTDREKLKEYILKHFEYRTAFVGEENGEITFVCRWNIEDEGRTATILDLYIREDYRNKNLVKQLLAKGIWLFPMVKYIKFERFVKGRPFRTLSVDRILKGKYAEAI